MMMFNMQIRIITRDNGISKAGPEYMYSLRGPRKETQKFFVVLIKYIIIRKIMVWKDDGFLS